VPLIKQICGRARLRRALIKPSDSRQPESVIPESRRSTNTKAVRIPLLTNARPKERSGPESRPTQQSQRIRGHRSPVCREERSFFNIVEFHPEIAGVTPAAVEHKATAVIREEWQSKPFVMAYRPVPAFVRIGDVDGMPAYADEFLVRDSNNVEGKVVAGVAQVPRSVPAAIARTIPIGRKRLVGVSKPPHWIHLLGGPEAAHLIWAMRYRCRRRAGRRSWLVNYGRHRCTTRINWDGLASRPRHTTEQKQPADLPPIIAPWNKAVRAHHEITV